MSNIKNLYQKDGNSFIDFRCLEDKKQYHFKILWDNGAYSLEWIQEEHPLSIDNKAAKVSFLKYNGEIGFPSKIRKNRKIKVSKIVTVDFWGDLITPGAP